ncbi:MAG: glycosyltransferase [Desulfovibrio sp.]|nr:glycosyltransferase [Desulfovibrio sp.]
MLLSLVTYTYNDHDFALDLLKIIPSFARPNEIIVVDDGSAVPFPAPDGVRVVRSESNRGPAQAKRLGIGAARGDVVLSLDCDIRPHRRWLHNALPLLADPKVALVGATIIPALADNYLSRARSVVLRPEKKTRQTRIVAAGIWLFLKKMWRQLNGLDAYVGKTHEDVWFSLKAGYAGFCLLRADTYPVYEKRRLHRLQYIRRHVRYGLCSRFRKAIQREEAPPALVLRNDLMKALQYCRKSGEWAFLYIEIVRIVAYIAESADFLENSAVSDKAAVTGGPAIATALRFFRPYPALSALMREDLAALGFFPSGADAGTSSFPYLENIFTSALPAEALTELDASWPEKLRQEDREKQYDFHYITSGIVSGG